MALRTEIPAVVEVEWLDSMQDHGWDTPANKLAVLRGKDAMIHRTCGYLIVDEPDYVGITISVGIGEDNLGSLIQIPRVSVLTLMELRPAMKRE